MESYLLILLISFIILYKYFNESEVTYVEFFDKNKIRKKYLVRNKPDKDKAVSTLFKIEISLIRLIERLFQDIHEIEKDGMKEYVDRLKGVMDNVKIQESSADSKYTSYSVNKGELLVFCIRSKNTSEIHDVNDLLYVAIHELAHIACPEVGHTPLFFEINKYLVNKAIGYNIYNYINYSIDKRDYCGMELNFNVANRQ